MPILGFWPAFFNSLSMILVTELGDKTFFIAAVLAMRYDRLLIFGGAIGKWEGEREGGREGGREEGMH